MLVLLFPQERCESLSPYLLQVLDGTDFVAAAVALIETAEPITGILPAFETELDCIGREPFALTLEVRTLFVSRAAATAMEDATFLFGNPVDEGEVGRTGGAIHSAGCKQF